ncbi:phage virion morphogenesis protein [Halorhodospira neutriphila]|uniref:Phage virion morphogenesis protein n=1 Tax=Halorhodospira neutriphila TaxID=168379 RepID=A0ABS1E415_9GAMM|nr:phage virion morphogenesis protein [Halorhodospira neutriphila]MBK1725713.1 phage virion morphogenesis protein [Halorhodospira neutriphila]
MATDDLQDLVEWADPFLEAMSASERRRLAQRIARGLRQRTRSRIADQENPDGSRYEPRVRQRGGGVRRRAMFRKLRQNKHLKTSADADAAAVGYRGRSARIARVHQYGLRSRVTPQGPWYEYPERKLLGLSREDREWLRDVLQDHLLGE